MRRRRLRLTRDEQRREHWGIVALTLIVIAMVLGAILYAVLR